MARTKANKAPKSVIAFFSHFQVAPQNKVQYIFILSTFVDLLYLGTQANTASGTVRHTPKIVPCGAVSEHAKIASAPKSRQLIYFESTRQDITPQN